MQRSLIPVRLTNQRAKRENVKDIKIKIPVKEVDWLENLLKEVLV
jgi:hypothetical protein